MKLEEVRDILEAMADLITGVHQHGLSMIIKRETIIFILIPKNNFENIIGLSSDEILNMKVSGRT